MARQFDFELDPEIDWSRHLARPGFTLGVHQFEKDGKTLGAVSIDLALALGPNALLYGTTGPVPGGKHVEGDGELNKEVARVAWAWIQFLERELEFWHAHIKEVPDESEGAPEADQ